MCTWRLITGAKFTQWNRFRSIYRVSVTLWRSSSLLYFAHLRGGKSIQRNLKQQKKKIASRGTSCSQMDKGIHFKPWIIYYIRFECFDLIAFTFLSANELWNYGRKKENTAFAAMITAPRNHLIKIPILFGRLRRKRTIVDVSCASDRLCEAEKNE